MLTGIPLLLGAASSLADSVAEALDARDDVAQRIATASRAEARAAMGRMHLLHEAEHLRRDLARWAPRQQSKLPRRAERAALMVQGIQESLDALEAELALRQVPHPVWPLPL